MVRRAKGPGCLEPHPRRTARDPARAGLRVLPAGEDDQFPAWGKETFPSWCEPLLWDEKAGLKGVRFLVVVPWAGLNEVIMGRSSASTCTDARRMGTSGIVRVGVAAVLIGLARGGPAPRRPRSGAGRWPRGRSAG